MILVTGAGGKTGRTLIKTLSNNESVCAFVHRKEDIPPLKALGAPLVCVGDLRDVTALGKAFHNVRAVYHICPNMNPHETEIGRLVIQAARAAGLEHFVYHSVLHPQIEQMPHHWAKLQVEEMLFESGLPFTILQPAPYMQNLLAGWDSILTKGIHLTPYSTEARISLVDLENIAQVAVKVLTEPGHAFATYELTGTLPLSQIEVAETFSRVLNRKVQAEKEEILKWRTHITGMGEYAVETLVKMFSYYDQFGLTGNPNMLSQLLGPEPTTLREFIERTEKERDAHH